jgi:hypothetical protein
LYPSEDFKIIDKIDVKQQTVNDIIINFINGRMLEPMAKLKKHNKENFQVKAFTAMCLESSRKRFVQ